MDRPVVRRGLLLLCLLVAASIVGGGAVSAQEAVTIVEVTHTGDAVVGRVNGEPQVASWRPHGVSVTVAG
ncbi:MAG: hypothetical protein R3324_13540, partial [Halobacteriales archaeon]|nr:hypothetical protein [Halobacteriales archaeon]